MESTTIILCEENKRIRLWERSTTLTFVLPSIIELYQLEVCRSVGITLRRQVSKQRLQDSHYIIQTRKKSVMYVDKKIPIPIPLYKSNT